MATVARLVIQANADVGGAVAQLTALERRLQSVSDSHNRAAAAVNAHTNALRSFNTQASNSSSSVNNSSSSFNRHTDSVNRNTNAIRGMHSALQTNNNLLNQHLSHVNNNSNGINRMGDSSRNAGRDLRVLAITMGVVAGTSLAPALGAASGALLGIASAASIAVIGLGAFVLAAGGLRGIGAHFNEVGEATKALQQRMAGVVAVPLEQWSRAVASAIGLLDPLVVGFANGLSVLAAHFSKLTQMESFRKALDTIAQAMSPIVSTLGKALLNFIVGWIQLAAAAAPLAIWLANGFLKLSESWLRWTASADKSEGFQKFVNWVKQNGPIIVGHLVSIGKSIIEIIAKLSPLGMSVLRVADAFFRWMASLSPAQLQTLVLSIAGAIIAFKLLNTVILPLVAIGSKLGAVFGSGGLVQTFLTLGKGAGILGAVLLILALAWDEVKKQAEQIWGVIQDKLVPAFERLGGHLSDAKEKCQPLIDVLQKLATAVVWLAGNALQGLVIVLSYVVDAIGLGIAVIGTVVGVITEVSLAVWNGFVPAMQAVGQFFIAVWNGIRDVAITVWNALVTAWNAVVNAFKTAWDTVSGALSAAWSAVWNGIKTAAEAVWNFLTSTWNTIVNGFKAAWDTVSSALSAAWSAVWNAIRTAAESVWNFLTSTWNTIVNGFKAAWDAVSGALQSAWSAVWNAIKTAAESVWNFLTSTWNTIVNAFKTAWDSVSGAFQSAWSTVWNAIKTAAEGVWNFMRDTWNTIVNAFKTAWDSVSGALQTAWSTVWNAMKAVGETVWNAMKAAWDTFLNTVKAIWDTVSNALRGAWETFWNTVKDIAQRIWDAIKTAWQTFLNTVRQIYDTVSGALKTAWETFWNTVKDIAQKIWDAIKNAWQTFWNGIKDIANKAIEGVKKIWSDVWNWAKDTFTDIKNKIIEVATDLWNRLKDGFGACADGIRTVWDKVKEYVGAPVKWVIDIVWNKTLREGWNAVNNLWGGEDLAPITVHFASGGYVRGAGTGTSDSIPARLSNGEYVVKASSVKKYGVNTMEAINNGTYKHRGRPVIMGFPDGGEVPPPIPRDANDRPLGTPGGTGNDADNDGTGQNGGGGLGGFIGDVGDALGDAAGKVKDAAGDVVEKAGDLVMKVIHKGIEFVRGAAADAFKKLMEPAVKMAKDVTLPGVAKDSMLGKQPGQWVEKTVESIYQFIKQKDAEAMFANGFVAWRHWQAGDEQQVSYHGGLMNKRTKEMLENAEKLLKKSFQVLQGSYSNSVGASAGTHAGGGVLDLTPHTNTEVGALRASGFAAWARTPAEGFSPHIHAVAVGDPTMSPQAAAQVDAFFRGRNGLANDGPDTFVGAGGNVLAWINQALAATSTPPPNTHNNWVAGMSTLISRESGGNPNAVNNTDSNAAKGTPSKGLCQVIQPTFDAYKQPGLPNDIMNPVSNCAAAINYIKARYGDIANVQQANPGAPPKGYHRGGVARRGWSWIGEKGAELVNFGRSSRVYNHKESMDMLGGSKGAEGGTHVTIGDGAVRIDIKGNVTPETLDRMKDDLVPALKMAIMAAVGKN